MTAPVLALTAMSAASCTSLLDHFVGEREKIVRDDETERLGRLEIDD